MPFPYPFHWLGYSRMPARQIGRELRLDWIAMIAGTALQIAIAAIIVYFCADGSCR